MKSWAKVYLVVVTLLLIFVVGVVGLNAFFWNALETEDPAVLGNIVLSARIVKPDNIDSVLQAPESSNSERVPKSGLYLATRAWQKKPSKNVLSMHAEFVAPEHLRGRKVLIPGSFLAEANYDVQPLNQLGPGDQRFTEEQVKAMLSQPAVLKLTKVSRK